MAPLKIGLTGGIAAGKSEALAAFGRLGAATASSDSIVHELLDDEPMISAIAERWGDGAVVDGAVDRSRVGEIVFADPGELGWLEAQIHPLVGSRIASWLESLPGRHARRGDRGAAPVRDRDGGPVRRDRQCPHLG